MVFKCKIFMCNYTISNKCSGVNIFICCVVKKKYKTAQNGNI